MIKIYIRYFVDKKCVVDKIALEDKILTEYDIKKGCIDFSPFEPYSGEECLVIKTFMKEDGSMEVKEETLKTIYKQKNGINYLYFNK